MNSWISIHREGALTLSPTDIALGHEELKSVIDHSSKRLRIADTVFMYLHAASTACIIMSLFAYFGNSFQKSPVAWVSEIAGALFVSSCLFIAFVRWAWISLQHGKLSRLSPCLLGIVTPPRLQNLISDLARGVRDARTSAGTTVPRSQFSSCWAIMLFSLSERDRQFVRGPTGVRQRQEIFVEPLSLAAGPPTGHGQGIHNEGLPSDRLDAVKAGATQRFVETATADIAILEPSGRVQSQGKSTLAAPMEISKMATPSPTEAAHNDSANIGRSDSGTRSRYDRIMLVAAALDEANISKRDVKSHHIAERWGNNADAQPDVGSVRALMKGKQAGAPSKKKVPSPTNPD